MTGVLPVWLGSVCADFGGGYVFGAQNVYAFFKKRKGGTHRKARSDSDAGIHRQRAMQKFYPRRALPLGLPRGANLLKPSIICAVKGKALPKAMQKFYPRRALPPRAPPRRKYLETIYHLRCKGKALPEGDAKILSEAGPAPSGSPEAQIS